jgi:hypothetical protein
VVLAGRPARTGLGPAHTRARRCHHRAGRPGGPTRLPLTGTGQPRGGRGETSTATTGRRRTGSAPLLISTSHRQAPRRITAGRHGAATVVEARLSSFESYLALFLSCVLPCHRDLRRFQARPKPGVPGHVQDLDGDPHRSGDHLGELDPRILAHRTKHLPDRHLRLPYISLVLDNRLPIRVSTGQKVADSCGDWSRQLAALLIRAG